MRSGMVLFVAAVWLSVGASTSVAVEPKEPIQESLLSIRGLYPIFASLRIGPHWRGPEAATLKQVAAAHKLFITSELEPTAKKHGVEIYQVDELLVAHMPKVGTLTIVTLVDEKAADAFDAALPPADGTGTLFNRTFATSSKDDSARQRIHPRVIQFGPSRGIRQLFGTNLPNAEKPIVEGFLSAAEKSNILTADISPAMFKGAVPVAGTLYEPLFEAQRWRITAHADKKLKIVLHAEFADEAGAKAAVESLAVCLNGLGAIFDLGGKSVAEGMQVDAKEFPNGPAVVPIVQRAFQDARKALGETKPVASGKTVEAVIEVETDRPVTTATILFTMLPRAKKETAPKDAAEPKPAVQPEKTK